MATTFIDGQFNLAALSVPGVYFDIIPPSPFLAGAPTNIVGLVGVGSWGPVDSIINVSTPDDCKRRLGVPTIRNSDIAWHVSCATKIGGAAAFKCVRVTDGTDVAATGKVQNTAARAQINFASNPTASSTITLNGTVVTFVASGATGNQVNIGGTLALTLTALGVFLAASVDVQISKCSYAPGTTTLPITYNTPGTAGNSFTVATTVTGATVTSPTLINGGAALTLTAKWTGTGGNSIRAILSKGTAPNTTMATIVYPGLPPEQFNNIPGTGATLWTNIAAAINSGTAYRSKSEYVTASSGGLSVAAVLGTAAAMAGGTDGASGVVAADLIGVDTFPRTGMYALRNSGIDTFELCDMTDSTLWPTIDAFALSENATAVVATASGTSSADTILARVAVGLDSFSSWIMTGDTPSLFDEQNQIVRLVSPAAIGVGFCGNASPEQSPLNKRLGGIVSTESSVEGTTYSSGDLSDINDGGIDVIIGPPSTVGGDFYSFASGRNAWSNTAGRGVEYSRMTKFIARSFNTFAAGQIVGLLQSSRPDDPTRERAKSLADGFFARLQDTNSGSGGQGMIDSFATVCDLTNNDLASQAAGYLFLAAAVRYLNTVRYFVVKFAGGGNVEIANSETAPSGVSFKFT